MMTRVSAGTKPSPVIVSRVPPAVEPVETNETKIDETFSILPKVTDLGWVIHRSLWLGIGIVGDHCYSRNLVDRERH